MYNEQDTAEILTCLETFPPFIEWSTGYPVPAEAWRRCQRGDWLLWLAARVGVQRDAVVQAAYGYIKKSLPPIPRDGTPDDLLPIRLAIEAIRVNSVEEILRLCQHARLECPRTHEQYIVDAIEHVTRYIDTYGVDLLQNARNMVAAARYSAYSVADRQCRYTWPDEYHWRLQRQYKRLSAIIHKYVPWEMVSDKIERIMAEKSGSPRLREGRAPWPGGVDAQQYNIGKGGEQ